MQIEFESTAVAQVQADALAIVCFEAAQSAPGQDAVSPSLMRDPELTLQSGWMAELRRSGEFTGKLYENALLHRPEGIAAKRLLVVGGGKQSKFSTVEARRIAGFIARTVRAKGIRSVALSLDGLEPSINDSDQNSHSLITEAVAEGAIIGNWEADRYKTDPKKNEKQVDVFKLVGSGG